MQHVIEVRRVPAEWSDDHRALADVAESLGLPPGAPEWTETLVVVEGVDGIPAWVRTIREAALTNTNREDEA
jgi:hypothetical protein